ncbi:methyltransferase [Salinisphaera sp. Q1T1-3]|uniref:methyltransferase n=1 Tax=Salinisphaera sp. Q1T1-3 TaxID=2321229 RepID=UPI0018F334B9|nr:methyltransferase [Salinisphaera sp. Q1T1-3]
MFDLCAGFVYSQVLVACVELDLFARLFEGPATAAGLAAHDDLDPDAMARLLAAAASLDLVEALGDGRYALAGLGAAAHGNPAVAAMVRHHRALYADLADPVARLRHRDAPSALNRFWAYAETPGASPEHERTAAYTQLMADSQAMIAEQVLASCDLSAVRAMLDVGGGSGVFAEHVTARWPRLQATVLDLPSVTAQAEQRLAQMPQAGRIACLGGDMHDMAWPTAQDLVTFVRILHDHEDETVAALLRRAHAALRPGGRLIIAEPMADTPGGAAIGAAYFGFYLWAMGQGRARDRAELGRLLGHAGFAGVRVLRPPNPLLAGVLEAYRTAATDGY